MRTATAISSGASFFDDCMMFPAVRDRLERGVKLHELDQLKKFLELNKQEAYLKKQYGHLIQDLEFLEVEGALKFPQIQPDLYLSIKPHWVAIKGYYQVNSSLLQQEDLTHRFFVNTPSLKSPILVLNNEAWRIYRRILLTNRNLTRYQAFNYLVYILYVLSVSESVYGSVIDDDFVRRTVFTYTAQEIQDVAVEYYECLLGSKIEDPNQKLPLLLKEDYCLPCNSWIFSDGWYFHVVVPTWTLSQRQGQDYSNNRLESWDFFTSDC
jgi:hypothetical protein